MIEKVIISLLMQGKRAADWFSAVLFFRAAGNAEMDRYEAKNVND